jgi:SAM-dependent methyltransferase
MTTEISNELPPGFDPNVYLQLYPDVAAAGIDPAVHYILHGKQEGRWYEPADIRNRCLAGLDVSVGRGLEIGALNRPLLPRHLGRIFFADHCSTAELKHKYSTGLPFPEDEICHVDFDLSKMTLRETDGGFDYVVASHVIEHVPDLVGWLRDLESILKVGGILALAIPDKRYTFDLFRRETTLWMVEQAVSRPRPDPETILDFFANLVTVDTARLWAGNDAADQAHKTYSAEDCVNVLSRYSAGEYIDVHCWVFTPASFRVLIEQVIVRFGLSFKIEFFEETHTRQLEFYVQLKKV